MVWAGSCQSVLCPWVQWYMAPSVWACSGSRGALFLGLGTGYMGMSTLCKLIELYTYNMCPLLYACSISIKLTLEIAPRWQRSKTRRSPSTPQIHQKYINMRNNSYRTPTELWQKTSDFPKGKKLPTYLGRAKEKRKNNY